MGPKVPFCRTNMMSKSQMTYAEFPYMLRNEKKLFLGFLSVVNKLVTTSHQMRLLTGSYFTRYLRSVLMWHGYVTKGV